MNKYDIPIEAHYPMDKKFFEFVQNSYQSAIKHLCATYGDNLILYGCDVSGAIRTAGAVVIDGELLPFMESPVSDKILIDEVVENALYTDGTQHPSFYYRTAKCSSIGTINIADLRRIRHTPTDWVDCTPTADIIVTQTIQCRINERGKVQLRGRYKHTGDWGFFYDFKLPESFRPQYDQASSIRLNEGSQVSFPLLIQSTGNVGGRQLGANAEYILNCEYDL